VKPEAGLLGWRNEQHIVRPMEGGKTRDFWVKVLTKHKKSGGINPPLKKSIN
jgi:hypothetical protein